MFKVANAVTALDHIPEDVKEILRSKPLQFYGYFKDQQKKVSPENYSFEIMTISKINGVERLRLYMPSVGDRIKEDPKKIFTGMSESASMEILEILRKALTREENIRRFNFKNNDVMFLNNDLLFHGREKFLGKFDRRLDRIQILAPGISRADLKPRETPCYENGSTINPYTR